MSAAFWFGAYDAVVSVMQTHILTVIENPERFGETRAAIEREYAHFNEPLGCERQAREAILRRVIKRDWIRVRRYRDRWALTVWCLNPGTYERVRAIAQRLLIGIEGVREVDRYARLCVTALCRQTTKTATVDGWAAEAPPYGCMGEKKEPERNGFADMEPSKSSECSRHVLQQVED